MLHAVHIVRDSTSDVSLIHAKIEKVLNQTKIGRDVTMQEGEGKIQIYQASDLADVRGNVTTNSGILQKIKLLEPIKIKNLEAELPVEGFGAESKFCQQF